MRFYPSLARLVLLLAVFGAQMEQALAQETRPIALGESVPAVMAAGEPEATIQVFDLVVPSDGLLTIELRSLDFDTGVRVAVPVPGGSASRILEDDDSGVGTDSQLVFGARHGDRLRIEVYPVDDTWGGEFEISVTGAGYGAIRGADSESERSYWKDVEFRANANGLSLRRARALDELGERDAAERLYREVLDTMETSLGPMHPKLAPAIQRLARVLGEKGSWDEAKPLRERVAAIRERQFGPDHPRYAEALARVAWPLTELGLHAEAEAILSRALAITEAALGPDHPQVVDRLELMAWALEEKGAWTEAKLLRERVATIQESALGTDHPKYAEALSKVAWSAANLGSWAEAEGLGRRALAITEAALGPDHPKVADRLERLAWVFGKKGDWGEAKLLRERVAAIREKQFGIDHPEYAEALKEVGIAASYLGSYEEAEEPMRRAVAITEAALGPDHPKVADRLGWLAWMLGEKGGWGDVKPLRERVAGIRGKRLGVDHPDYADALEDVGIAATHLGSYAEAEELMRRAVAITEAALGPDHPKVADRLGWLAWMFAEKAEWGEAKSLRERVAAIRGKQLGMDHPDYAEALEDVGIVATHLGSYAEAEELMRRAVAITEAALGPDHPKVADRLGWLAWMFAEKGEWGEAKSLREHVAAIRWKQLGMDHPDYAKALQNVGIAATHLGSYDEAEELMRRAVAITEAALGPDHPKVADRLGWLAWMFAEKAEWGEAKSLRERVAAIRGKQLGMDHPDYAEALEDVGIVATHLGSYAEAEELMRRAVAITEAALGPDHPKVADRLGWLAWMFAEKGEWGEAKSLREHVAAIRWKQLGMDHPDYAKALQNVGIAATHLGSYDEAEELMRRAVAITEAALGLDHPKVADRLGWLAWMFAEKGEWGEAKSLRERVAAIRGKQLGMDHPDYAEALEDVGIVATHLGSYDEAEELMRRAVAITEAALGPDHPKVADRLAWLAWMFAEKGEWGEAKSLRERVAAIRGKQLGMDHPDYADALEDVGIAATHLGSYDEAEELMRRAVAITEAALGPDHPKVADRLAWLAWMFAEKGEWGEVKPLRERVAAIQGKQLGMDHPVYAEALESVGLAATHLGSYDEAEKLMRRAVAITDTALGPNHPKVVDRLAELAWMLGERGAWADARRLRERVATIVLETLGEDNEEYASALLNLAIAVAATQSFDEAQEVFRRVLRIAEATELHGWFLGPKVLALRPSSPSEAIPLLESVLSLDMRKRNVTSAAVTLFLLQLLPAPDASNSPAGPLAWLAAQEERLDPQVSSEAQDLLAIAAVWIVKGSIAKARANYARVLDVSEPDSPVHLSALQGSAVALWELGLFREAKAQYEELLALLQRRGGVTLQLAHAELQLALLLEQLGECTGALQLLRQSGKRFEEQGQEGCAWLARLATLRVLTSGGMTEADEARSMAEELTQENRKNQFELNAGIMITKTGSVDVSSLGTGMMADKLFATPPSAPTLMGKTDSCDFTFPNMAHMFPSLGFRLQQQCSEFRWYRGREAKALKEASRGVSLLIETMYDVVQQLPEREALQFVNTREPVESILFSGMLLGHSKRQAWLDACWGWALGRRALVLDELGRRQRGALDSESPTALEAWQRLVDSRRRLAAFMIPMLGGGSSEKYEEARQAKEAAERALARVSESYRREQQVSRATVTEVAAALPGDSVLVEYVRVIIREPLQDEGSAHYVALILPRSGRRPDFADLGPAEAIDDLVFEWQSRLRRSWTGAEPVVSLDDVAEVGSRLREAVWEPVAARIGKARLVFVVPDGSLHRIHFAALPAREGGYLAESGTAFQLLSTGRDLVRLHSAPVQEKVGSGILALGDPDYDAGRDLRLAVLHDAEEVAGTFRGDRSECWELTGLPNWSALPQSGAEAREIGKLFEGIEPAVVLTGAAASEERLKQEASGKRIVHLATHGFFLDGRRCSPAARGERGIGALVVAEAPAAAVESSPLPETIAVEPGPGDGSVSGKELSASALSRIRLNENPLLLSGLALAGANRAGEVEWEAEDGILTAEEIAALDLRGVEIAVLSACDTGLGSVEAGEGVLGLRRAFEIAGVRSVLMSLWPVPDEATREWMTGFYRARLGGASVQQASREVSLSALAALRAQGQPTHPYLWAGFVAAGDWR